MKNSFTLNSAYVSDRGLSEKRPHNEDSFLVNNYKGIFVVADGVGGSQAGEVASQMAVEVLEQAFGQWNENVDAEDLMLRAIQHANGSIYQMSHDLPSLASMATTIVALHLDGNIATIGHVGDSRLYRLDPRKNLFRETQDHSVVEEEVRAGRMTVMQAETHPSRNVISRALGADNSVEVDMKTIMFEPETLFLLCSDGITRHISEIEIRELLVTCQTPTEACREMKNLCFNRGAEDNLTAVIIEIQHNLNEIEESTLATSRQSYQNQTYEIPAQPLQKQTDSFQNSNSQMSVPTTQNQDNAMFRMENAMAASSDDDNRLYEKMKLERAEIIQSSKKGFIGKLLTWLILLSLGFILGAFGLYGFQQTMNLVPENTPATQPQPNAANTAKENLFAGFETNRRIVDANPAEYIKTNSVSADEAEDFYLLGRANFLLADYPKAKENFKKAKDMANFTPETNRKTIERDIALFTAIMADADATKVFEKEKMSGANTAEPNKEAVKPQ
jgi:serine/threonine protein phosphatase PrpC